MEKEEIENIIMVGKFMGVEDLFPYKHNDTVVGIYEAEDEDGSIDYTDVGIRWYQPHEDWNTLIPIIEKIRAIKAMGLFYNIDYSIDCCGWICWHKNRPGDINQDQYYPSDENIDLIDGNFIAVVEFIKWYNKNATTTNH